MERPPVVPIDTDLILACHHHQLPGVQVKELQEGPVPATELAPAFVFCPPSSQMPWGRHKLPPLCPF